MSEIVAKPSAREPTILSPAPPVRPLLPPLEWIDGDVYDPIAISSDRPNGFVGDASTREPLRPISSVFRSLHSQLPLSSQLNSFWITFDKKKLKILFEF